MKNLTKSEAVRLHREMWNWIANKLEGKNGSYYLNELKEIYIYSVLELDIEEEYILNDCFCCEYAKMDNGDFDCSRCPLIWGTEENAKEYFCEEGFYEIPNELPIAKIRTDGLWTDARELTFEDRAEDAAKYARYIANLPEKEDV